MQPWFNESARTLTSVALLLVLLSWESSAPFFAYFKHAPGERLRHGLRNLTLGGLNAALNGIICVGLWWTVARWAEAHQFGVLHWLRLPSWAHLVGMFLLMDLWMYVWHRLNHRIPLLWRFHRVHHSDPKVDVTTANRFHVGEIVLSCLLRVPVIALAGIQLWELALYETAMFAVVQLHHANISFSSPVDRVLRLFIVTPFMHKVHHSNWQSETDSNYSPLFSFWDRLFGTFRLRDNPRALRYGLTELSAVEHHTLGGLFATPFKHVDRIAEVPRDTAHDHCACIDANR